MASRLLASFQQAQPITGQIACSIQTVIDLRGGAGDRSGADGQSVAID
ncbi:MAG: hypothetical protein IPI20_10555 [Rhodoferax sp.]|nr:hypothetical protein [Rhodoferax sp.]